MSSLKPRPACLRSGFAPERGFTLPELLVAVLVAGLVLAAAGGVIVQHMRMVRSLELAQRERDNSARLDYLIQIEAGEAKGVLKSSALDGCKGSGGSSVFTLLVPKDEGPYQSNDSKIHYYNDGQGNVRRCGPLVNANGTLNHQGPIQDGIVIRDASIDASITCQGRQTSDDQLAYLLSYAGNGYQPECSIAQAKTVYIR